MKRRLSIIVLSLTAVALAMADSEARPVPRVTATDDGRLFFLMVPPAYREADWQMLRKPYGVLYEPQPDGTFKEKWRVRGWYSHEVFLTWDGKYLVRMGPWQMGEAPTKHHLAVAFYEDGKLLKKHSVAKLIKNPTSVRRSVSHYDWRDDGAGYPCLRDHLFLVRTVEGKVISFSTTTGDLLTIKDAKEAEQDAAGQPPPAGVSK